MKHMKKTFASSSFSPFHGQGCLVPDSRTPPSYLKNGGGMVDNLIVPIISG